MNGRALVALLVASCALQLWGCGSKDSSADRIKGDTLTIYASLPFHGPLRADAAAVLGGAQLALDQVHSKIGKYRIEFRPLDDSTVQRDGWDPGQTTANARQAISDRTTVGYIGEFDSGASAVSIPVLNRTGIPQISPASAAVGLTSAAAGSAPGEPQKYYPTGVRTYLRVVPSDAVQAAVQVKLQQQSGCHRTFVVDDGGVDGEDMADSFELVARSAGLEVIGVQAFQALATDYTPFAQGIANSGADCVLISAGSGTGAALVTKQIAAAMPDARIFAAAGLANGAFVNPTQGGIPLALGHRVTVTLPALPPGVDPPARAFYAAYQRRYGSPQPYAIFGYEAMSLLLDAIDRASSDGKHTLRRSKVLAALFSTRQRRSVLGTYSMTPDGDPTIRRYGVYRIVGGRLRYLEAVDG